MTNRAFPFVLAIAAGCWLGGALAQSPAPSPIQQALNRTEDEPAQAGSASSHRNEASAPASPASTEAHAFLGVLVMPVGEALRDQLSALIPAGTGVLVGKIQDGSPAAKAGLRRHDVLLALDGKPIAGPEDLVRRMRDVKPGQQLSIALVRGAQKQDVPVTASEAPAPRCKSLLWNEPPEHRALREAVMDHM